MKAPFLAFLVLATPSILIPGRANEEPSIDWHDLVGRMSGNWNMTGQIVGQDAHHFVEAEWVLNRQFLRIHEKTAPGAPASEHRYEATWFLGYDTVSDRYVMHLLDVFGGRFSETIGYGVRDGDSIRFVFEYPDGPFHTTFSWASKADSWQWLMVQKDKNGRWTQFADLKLAHVPR